MDWIEDLVAGSSRVATSFSDLNLAEPNGTLEVRRRIPSVTCIRVELPKFESLQLASVLIEADGVTDPPVQGNVTASRSAKPGERVAKELLFDPANRKTAVHTEKKLLPWLEIRFDEPVTVTSIKLRNGSDTTRGISDRIRGIQLLALPRHGEWMTLYDGWSRERTFVHALEHWYSRRAFARRAGTQLMNWMGRQSSSEDIDQEQLLREARLTRVLTAIHLRDYEVASAQLDRLRLPAIEKSRFKELINARILASRRLEFCLHGIRRTFRYWTKSQQENYVGFAVDVANALQELNGNVCFGFGSALAIVRDQALIPHDNDMDILIGFEPSQASTLAEGMNLIRKSLRRQGFIVKGNYIAHLWVKRQGEAKKLDVFVGIFEGDSIAWYPNRRGLLTRQMMFPPRDRTLLGYSCPVPHEPERYLKQVYGPTWKTPDPNFHHRHDLTRAGYADIR
jgi:hypothetical protein